MATDAGAGSSQLPPVEPATAGQRFGAAGIDLTVLLVAYFLVFPVIVVVLWLLHVDLSSDPAGMSQAVAAIAFLVAIIITAMPGVALGIHGRSVGRVWLGLCVAQSDGSAAPPVRLFLRYVVKMACYPMGFILITLIAPPAGALAQLMSPLWLILLATRRWTLWDYLAKTTVIQESESAALDPVSRFILALGRHNGRRRSPRLVP